MSEIKSINLNTLFCSNQYQTNYLSNPSWILPESIENINSFKLNDFTIPLSIYNIDNRNNILSITQGTNGPFIITIPAKNYTGLSIASSLTTALNSAGSGFNVNYQTDGSNLLTIGSTSGSFKFNTVNTGNDIYYELGLNLNYLKHLAETSLCNYQKWNTQHYLKQGITNFVSDKNTLIDQKE